MINLSIIEQSTPVGGAAATVPTGGQASVGVGTGFLQILADSPLPKGGAASVVEVEQIQTDGQGAVPEIGVLLAQMAVLRPDSEKDHLPGQHGLSGQYDGVPTSEDALEPVMAEEIPLLEGANATNISKTAIIPAAPVMPVVPVFPRQGAAKVPEDNNTEALQPGSRRNTVSIQNSATAPAPMRSELTKEVPQKGIAAFVDKGGVGNGAGVLKETAPLTAIEPENTLSVEKTALGSEMWNQTSPRADAGPARVTGGGQPATPVYGAQKEYMQGFSPVGAAETVKLETRTVKAPDAAFSDQQTIATDGFKTPESAPLNSREKNSRQPLPDQLANQIPAGHSDTGKSQAVENRLQARPIVAGENSPLVKIQPDTSKPAPKHRDRPRTADQPALPASNTTAPSQTYPYGINSLTVENEFNIVPETAESLEPLDFPTGEVNRHVEPAMTRTNPAVTTPEIPRHVARQLADVARQMPDRPVELTLNPEELGRVRLTFTLTDGGINVAVLVERGETMDLMRRHIETLAQEFRDMGYSDVGFQFSQNGQADTDAGDDATGHGQTVNAPLPEPEFTPPAKLSLEPSTGLDLRL